MIVLNDKLIEQVLDSSKLLVGVIYRASLHGREYQLEQLQNDVSVEWFWKEQDGSLWQNSALIIDNCYYGERIDTRKVKNHTVMVG